MKIAVIIEDRLTAGGGFNQAVNAALQMKRLAKGRFDFAIFTTISENVTVLESLGLEAERIRFRALDRFLGRLVRNGTGRWLQKKLRRIGPFERHLMNKGVDLVYFVKPSSRCFALQRLNYIMTVWDLCHRDLPEFPEVREFGELLGREAFLRNALPPAALVVADSDELIDRMVARYGIEKERIIAIPFLHAPSLAEEHAVDTASVLKKYGLSEGYYFYPAQFWAHKNHVRILQATAMLQQRDRNAEVVFAGGDQGNLAYVKKVAESLGISARVRFLGFVPHEDLRGLYEGCAAVVMLTYFGPTNLPPLEAWTVGRPLVYPAHLSGQAGDAALLVDVDDAGALAAAMKKVREPDTARSLVERGGRRLQEIEKTRKEAEGMLLQYLERYGKKRECWE
jgi:glycosyltransferase involved in cell wall biosynthesis